MAPIASAYWVRTAGLVCSGCVCTFRGSIVVSISARHAEDPGSIPGRGILLWIGGARLCVYVCVRVWFVCCARGCGNDTVSERLRRWTRNPLGSARRGSNPLGVVLLFLVMGGFAAGVLGK